MGPVYKPEAYPSYLLCLTELHSIPQQHCDLGEVKYMSFWGLFLIQTYRFMQRWGEGEATVPESKCDRMECHKRNSKGWLSQRWVNSKKKTEGKQLDRVKKVQSGIRSILRWSLKK